MSAVFKNNAPLVYSTEGGRICSSCSQPMAQCTCRQKPLPAHEEGFLSVKRETKGRRGKTVTLISGMSLSTENLHRLASDLKKQFGAGGSVKDGTILIQGDHCHTLTNILEKWGYKVKQAEKIT